MLKPGQVDDIPGAVERSVEASLRRLQRDSVDLIYLHSTVTLTRGTFRDSISIEDVLGEEGVVTAFDKLRQRGLARLFGFTGFGDTDCLHRMITSGYPAYLANSLAVRLRRAISACSVLCS